MADWLSRNLAVDSGRMQGRGRAKGRGKGSVGGETPQGTQAGFGHATQGASDLSGLVREWLADKEDQDNAAIARVTKEVRLHTKMPWSVAAPPQHLMSTQK